MSHITYTELRQNLARYLDEVVESRTPIVVTRQSGKGNTESGTTGTGCARSTS